MSTWLLAGCQQVLCFVRSVNSMYSSCSQKGTLLCRLLCQCQAPPLCRLGGPLHRIYKAQSSRGQTRHTNLPSPDNVVDAWLASDSR